MTDKELDAIYANEEWGKLAIEFGYLPRNVESQARSVLSKAASVINSLRERLAILKDESLPSYSYEYTDTFGGEANYSWVKRGKVTANNFTHAIRKVKKELGITHRTRKVMDAGDMVRHDLVGCCLCIFINWSEE